MHYVIQIHAFVIRWLTLEILMQLILLSMIQVLFFHIGVLRGGPRGPCPPPLTLVKV